MCPCMNKIESQSPMLLCSKFGWIWPSGLDAFENVKSKQTEKRTDRWCRREYQKSSHRILFKWAKKEPNQFYWMLRVILWGDLKWLYKVNDMSSKHIENMKQLEHMYPVVQSIFATLNLTSMKPTEYIQCSLISQMASLKYSAELL